MGTKITSMTELTSALLTDLLLVVDDPGGSPATKKMTIDTLFDIFHAHAVGKIVWQVKLIADDTDCSVGDGVLTLCIDDVRLNGANLIDAQAFVSTAPTGAAISVQIHNATDTQDMLTTNITIDAGEYTSYDAATPSVVNASYDDVVTGDRIRFDIDQVGSTIAGMGLGVILVWQVP